MPRMIDLIRASAVPATLMQSAARGALSVPPQEMIEILVYLATQNKVFGEQARLTLAGWEESASKTAASDPKTPKEVLEYLSSPQNLRPVLLPALLENISVAEESLSQLAAAASRDAVETLLQSNRVTQSSAILEALRANPNLSGIQSQHVDEKISAAMNPALVTPEQPASSPEHANQIAQAMLPAASVEHPSGEDQNTENKSDSQSDDQILDQDVVAFLSTHAKEIEAEGEKPFQAIGGIYDDILEPQDTGKDKEKEKDKKSPANVPSDKKVAKKPQEEERGSALQKIAKLDIKGRIQLALKGTKEERSLLIRDGTKIVALAVLESPKVTDGEVEKFASQKNVLESVLRGIPMKRRFAKNYVVVRNLVFNPRTPLDLSLGLMKNILINDLRNLSGNKEVSETVRKLALKMYKQKSDPNNKNV